MREPFVNPLHVDAIHRSAKRPEHYWASAEADFRELRSIPVLTAASPRKIAALSPRAAALPPPTPRRKFRAPPSSEELSHLRALEAWLRTELAPLPPTAPQRLVAFRHVFTELISELRAYGPLLAEVKSEYERALSASSRAGAGAADSLGPAPRPLGALHPLQLPASYYEAQWRRCQDELNLVTGQRQRLRRMVRELRAGCAEATRCMTHVGDDEPVAPRADPRGSGGGSGGSGAGGAGGGGGPMTRGWLLSADELDVDGADDDVGELDAAMAVARAQAVVSGEMEEAVSGEVGGMREAMRTLETRVLGAGRLSELLQQSSLAARLQLEEVLTKAAAEVEASPADEVARARTNELEVLLKMLRAHEEHVESARRLLREPASLDQETLNKLAIA
jgi:hypothetical protein